MQRRQILSFIMLEVNCEFESSINMPAPFPDKSSMSDERTDDDGNVKYASCSFLQGPHGDGQGVKMGVDKKVAGAYEGGDMKPLGSEEVGVQSNGMMVQNGVDER